MIKINPEELLVVARQVHANLRVLQAQAEANQPDIATVAQIVSSTASIINDWTPIKIRRRWAPGDISSGGIWHDIKPHVPHLARFITAYQVNPTEAENLIKPARNRLLAIGIILYGVLSCDNIRRALHGDTSRPIIAIDGPAADYSPRQLIEEAHMVVKVHFKMERMAPDLRAVMANLKAISEEVAKGRQWSAAEVALLIGPILNLAVHHITLPPRQGPPGTMTSREWIKQVTDECLEQTNKLYSIALKPPTDEGRLQEFKVRATHTWVHLFVTYREIYLAPDIQNALSLTESESA